MTNGGSVAEKNDLSTRFEGVDLVGTVGTMYSDPKDPRFEVALDTAERYEIAGLPLIVVDNSNIDYSWPTDAFERRGAIVLRADTGGVATQRQQGVRFAVENGAKRVVGHEAEKNLMVTFAPEIAGSLDTSDVLVIGRTQEAEDSLPPVQQRTERLAGWILEEALGLPPDTLSGGRGFSIAGAESLAAYPANEEGMNNWIYLYDTLLDARARGRKTGSLMVDLIHPEVMVAEETDNPVFDAKRYMQFNLQLSYLLRRPEVRAEATYLASFILNGLHRLPINPSPADNVAYESFLNDLEMRVLDLGYSPANRQE